MEKNPVYGTNIWGKKKRWKSRLKNKTFAQRVPVFFFSFNVKQNLKCEQNKFGENSIFLRINLENRNLIARERKKTNKILSKSDQNNPTKKRKCAHKIWLRKT